MAHLIFLADTYTNFHHCFKAFLDKRGESEDYKSHWGLKLREIKLYDLIYDERDEEQVLKDLKHFEYERNYLKESNKVVKFIRKMLRKYLKIEIISMKNVEPTRFTMADKHIAPYPEWFCYTKVIGKVKDTYHENGMEML